MNQEQPSRDLAAIVKDVFVYAPAPLIAAWVAEWLPRDALATLAFAAWQPDAREEAVSLGRVLVFCALGYCLFDSCATARRLAIWSTAVFVMGAVGCAVLEFVVGEVLDRQTSTIMIRDYVWKYAYVLTLIFMVLAVFFWTFHMMTGLRPRGK